MKTKLRFALLRIVLVIVVFNYYGVTSNPQEDEASNPSGGIDDVLHPDTLPSVVDSSVDPSRHDVNDYQDVDNEGSRSADDVDVLGDDGTIVQPVMILNMTERDKTKEVKDETELPDKKSQDIAASESSGIVHDGGDESAVQEAVDEVAVAAEPPDDKKHVDSEAESDPLVVNDDKQLVDEVAETTSLDVSTVYSDVRVVVPSDTLVVRDDDGQVVELRGGKSYTGAVCSPSLNDLEDGIITMPPPPLDPACKAYFWTASVEEGFMPDITLESLSLDHKVGEFMIIGAGSDRDVLWVDETNPMITASVVTPKLFRVLTSHVFSVFLVTNTPTGFKGNFSLRYQPEGLIETTTEPPTTGPTLPTPGPNITAEITIFIGGKQAADYTAMDENNSTLKDQLRGVIAEMASNYTSLYNISITEDVTTDNVLFSLLRECNEAWANYYYCVQVNMSVAVHTKQPERYEMTAAHLTDMWSKINKNDARLTNLGLHKYEEPNAARSMYLWLGLSIIVLVLFICILIVVWRVEIWEYKRMHSKSESGYSARSSSASTDSVWFPASEHQLVPPYMESFSEGYVEYEPEFDGPAPAPKYQTLPTVVTTPASPPRYGPPNSFGGAIHFYGNNARQHYNNPAFLEDEEDEINTASGRGGLTLTRNQHNDDIDNSNC